MSLEHLALTNTSDFPIRHEGKVHTGKVRSVYWLSPEDSAVLIEGRGYTNVHRADRLGVMVISDRITAFDVQWKGEQGLAGIPGKGMALNAISQHWFNALRGASIGNHHFVEAPHPLVWLVRKAEPVKIEAIARAYITGSMWRAYKKGARKFCGITLSDGLNEYDKLPEVLITPTTKGVLRGVPGVLEEEDTSLTRKQLVENLEAFGFKLPRDVFSYEQLLRRGFELISQHLGRVGQLLVDTKFEFGYAKNPLPRAMDSQEMIYIDEVGTPDSSRMWDAAAYSQGKVVERSKEKLRKLLLETLDRAVLLDAGRMEERRNLADGYRVPLDVMMETSEIYTRMAEEITGKPLPKVEDARGEIIQALSEYGLVR
ncbi:MAG TPA: phosphoribosylaminoimidazolesuccinocarboxamide synthase [Candidatus Nanoarchaeia archaeon]|nr:phosphoribosylaminoimidazolesuccinocarboxamide synthase [Candidatus Nanoarchaeia archaeon]